MTLTITLERKDRMGSMKMFIFKVVDSDGSGGTLAVGNYVSHIHNVHLQNMTGTTWTSAIWTDGSEDITIGSEGSGDTFKVTVWGS